eukprot:168741_1
MASSVMDIYINGWTDVNSPIIFLASFLFFGTTVVFLQSKKDAEFTSIVISALHAVIVYILALSIFTNYGHEMEIQSQHKESVLFTLFPYIASFSTPYFILDSILVYLMDNKSSAYKYIIIIHHILWAMCSWVVFIKNPYVSYFYATNILLEGSNVFLYTRYFGKYYGNKELYCVGGVGLLITYPLLRLSVTAYCTHLAYYGPLESFIGVYGTRLAIVTNVFVFALSFYYTTFVLFPNYQRVYKLNKAID